MLSMIWQVSAGTLLKARLIESTGYFLHSISRIKKIVPVAVPLRGNTKHQPCQVCLRLLSSNSDLVAFEPAFPIVSSEIMIS